MKPTVRGSLLLATRGQTLTPKSLEIAEHLELPPSLENRFNNRGYYGTVSHNAKATYQKYLGFFDGNPANLNPLPPEDSAGRYVETMGGADAVLAKARESFDAGEYRWVAQLVNHVVFAEPDNSEARELQADALEQLGYQAESGPWRNFYLTGAQELREGKSTAGAGMGGAPYRMLIAMPIDMIFDSIAVRINGPRADGTTISVNWDFTDIDEQWVLGLEHGALHSNRGSADEADAGLTLTRTTFAEILSGMTDMAEALSSGAVTIEGDANALISLFGFLDDPDHQFDIVTP